jgi:hypothetical protein
MGMTRPANPSPVARSDDRPGPRVTAVLESLARQHASGVLEIDGNPAGVIYLDHGQITYAQASWVPDLAARFCASRQPPADVRALLLGGDRVGGEWDGGARGGGARGGGDRDGGDRDGGARSRDLGAILLSCMSRTELQELLRSVIVDAVLALTVPLSGDAAVSGIRFEAPRAHWASAFARLPLDSVREETVCRAARMARYQVSRTSTVSLRDLDHDAMVLTREQWAVASRVGRTSTVRDLAWRSGLALCDTIECVARLVRAGVCTLGPALAASNAPASTPSQAPGGTSSSGSAAASASASSRAPSSARVSPAGAAQPGTTPVPLPAPEAPEPLPRRRPGTHLASELSAARDEIQAGAGGPWPALPIPPTYSPPPPDVLHRLLDGLRNLK